MVGPVVFARSHGTMKQSSVVLAASVGRFDGRAGYTHII